ncbi:unnamed protein product, partial [Phaeothamnion confervicola]
RRTASGSSRRTSCRPVRRKVRGRCRRRESGRGEDAASEDAAGTEEGERSGREENSRLRGEAGLAWRAETRFFSFSSFMVEGLPASEALLTTLAASTRCRAALWEIVHLSSAWMNMVPASYLPVQIWS